MRASDRLVPTGVVGVPAWSHVSTSGLVACGLDVDGRAWCWGSDASGALGRGLGAEQPTPLEVAPRGGWSAKSWVAESLWSRPSGVRR